MAKIIPKNNRFYQTLAPKDLENISKLVEEGKYKSRGDFVQIAVKKLLEKELKSSNLDREAIEVLKEALKLK